MAEENKIKIGFIGCGKLGAPTAQLLAEHYEVNGFDLTEKKPAGVRMHNSAAAAVAGCNFVFIAVQTPHSPEYGGTQPVNNLPPRNFDYTVLINCINRIAEHLSKNCVVVIISTVLPGTIREVIHPLLPAHTTLLYNPYLIAMGTVREDLIKPEMLIIGAAGKNEPALKKLLRLYQPIIKANTRIEFGTWEEAEAIKIFYNTFISMKLSFVNMIQDVAEKLGNINPDVVTQAIAKSTLRITSSAYMQSGMGDGGPCHPRDNIALRYLAEKLELGYDLFGAIAESRDMQAKNLAQYLLTLSRNIVILGRAYKPGINLDDGSYAVLVGNYITALNGNVKYYDPDMNYTDTNFNSNAVFLINYHADWLPSFPFTDGCIVVDPWRKWKTENEKIKVLYYGIKE